MPVTNLRIIRWILFTSFISLANAQLRNYFFFLLFGDDKECTKMYNISDEKILELDRAQKPNNAYSCFVGCIMLHKGVVSYRNMWF